MDEAMAVLREGGSALDAVETCIRAVESNLADSTVGKGGIPNLLGHVELDASVMDGRTLAAGAVGAVRGFEHPVSIARKVMEKLPHVLLVGEGAERFAREMGFEETELLTDAARATWRQGLHAMTGADATVPTYLGDRQRYLDQISGFARQLATDPDFVKRLTGHDDPGKVFGTVNVIARDRRGHMACGVSTSGWAWKYPGRLGDSPIIGAGNYCDDRYGAAACTGRGEMAIRCATAHSAVMYLKLGMDLHKAGLTAMSDFNGLVDPFFGAINIVLVDRDGNHGAFSNNPQAVYAFMSADMAEPVISPRTHVALTPRPAD